MMNLQQFLLTKLVEEMNEVSEFALKSQQWGWDNKHPNKILNNREGICEEMNDVMASIDMLNAIGLDYTPNPVSIHHKKEKVKHFLKQQIELGFVEPSALKELEEMGQ